MTTIRTAAVIGSGVMGSGIAAHLANVGIPVLLLDRVPEKLTATRGSSRPYADHPKVRNRFAVNAMDKLRKQILLPCTAKLLLERITPGNMEDDLAKLSSVDWIVEVIVENLSEAAAYCRIEKFGSQVRSFPRIHRGFRLMPWLQMRARFKKKFSWHSFF